MISFALSSFSWCEKYTIQLLVGAYVKNHRLDFNIYDMLLAQFI